MTCGSLARDSGVDHSGSLSWCRATGQVWLILTSSQFSLTTGAESTQCWTCCTRLEALGRPGRPGPTREERYVAMVGWDWHRKTPRRRRDLLSFLQSRHLLKTASLISNRSFLSIASAFSLYRYYVCKTQSVSEYIPVIYCIIYVLLEYAYCPRDAMVDCSKLQLKVGFVCKNCCSNF